MAKSETDDRIRYGVRDADRGAATLTIDPMRVYMEENPKHPRFDKRIVTHPITESFINSLDPDKGGRQEEAGIVVKRDDGSAEVANGRRRLRALRILNERRVAAGKEIVLFWCTYRRMKDPSDHAEFRAIGDVANLHEGDTVMALAERAARYIEEDKWPRDKVANLFDWTTANLDRYLALLEAAAPVRAAVDAGRLPIVAAAKIAGLPRDKQAAELEAVLGARSSAQAKKRKPGTTTSGRPSAKRVRDVLTAAMPATMKVRQDHPVAAFVLALQWVAGLRDDLAVAEYLPALRAVLAPANARTDEDEAA